MAIIDEIVKNFQNIDTAKQNIKSAIESKGQNLNNVPFAEYANKIRAIQTTGGQFVTKEKKITNNGTYNASDDGVDAYSRVIVDVPIASGDLLDAVELPTVNVDNDKIYRARHNEEFFMFYYMGMSMPFTPDSFKVNSIEDVVDPIASPLDDAFSWVIYLDTNTYIGYLWSDINGDGTLTRMSIAEAMKLSDPELNISDNGLITDVADMTEDGVYYMVINATIVGVPNVNNDKSIYYYDGANWILFSNASEDKLVGTWDYLNSKVVFKEGVVRYLESDDFLGSYSFSDDSVAITDIDGVMKFYDYIYNSEEYTIKLVNKNDESDVFTKVLFL